MQLNISTLFRGKQQITKPQARKLMELDKEGRMRDIDKDYSFLSYTEHSGAAEAFEKLTSRKPVYIASGSFISDGVQELNDPEMLDLVETHTKLTPQEEKNLDTLFSGDQKAIEEAVDSRLKELDKEERFRIKDKNFSSETYRDGSGAGEAKEKLRKHNPVFIANLDEYNSFTPMIGMMSGPKIPVQEVRDLKDVLLVPEEKAKIDPGNINNWNIGLPGDKPKSLLEMAQKPKIGLPDPTAVGMGQTLVKMSMEQKPLGLSDSTVEGNKPESLLEMAQKPKIGLPNPTVVGMGQTLVKMSMEQKPLGLSDSTVEGNKPESLLEMAQKPKIGLPNPTVVGMGQTLVNMSMGQKPLGLSDSTADTVNSEKKDPFASLPSKKLDEKLPGSSTLMGPIPISMGDFPKKNRTLADTAMTGALLGFNMSHLTYKNKKDTIDVLKGIMNGRKPFEGNYKDTFTIHIKGLDVNDSDIKQVIKEAKDIGIEILPE